MPVMPRINVPPLTRGLLVFVLIFTLLNAAFSYRHVPLLERHTVALPFLTIVPQASITSPWVFLTAALIEQNLFSLAISGTTIFFGGRYLERAWGGSEYAKFLLFVTVIPNLLTFVAYWIWFSITGNEGRLYVLS